MKHWHSFHHSLASGSRGRQYSSYLQYLLLGRHEEHLACKNVLCFLQRFYYSKEGQLNITQSSNSCAYYVVTATSSALVLQWSTVLWAEPPTLLDWEGTLPVF